MAELIDIVNKALRELGAASLVSMDDPSPNAERARSAWPLCRDAVLREHYWKCAQRRAKLNELADKPAFGFARRFQLPGDFIRLVEVWPRGARFAIEGDSLMTDEKEVSIAYVRRLEDPSKYDAALTQCLALRLALDLSFDVTGGVALEQRLAEKYRLALADARFYDSGEASPQRPGMGSWAGAKLGG